MLRLTVAAVALFGNVLAAHGSSHGVGAKFPQDIRHNSQRRAADFSAPGTTVVSVTNCADGATDTTNCRCRRDPTCADYDYSGCVGGVQRCSACPHHQELNKAGTGCAAISTQPNVQILAVRTGPASHTVAWLMDPATTKPPLSLHTFPPSAANTPPTQAGTNTITLSNVQSTGTFTINANDASGVGGYTYAIVDADGIVVAHTRQYPSVHPRMGLTPARVATLKSLIAVDGTPKKAFNSLLSRVNFNYPAIAACNNTAVRVAYNYGFGEGEARYAHEAAMAYALTGEQTQADRAYKAFGCATNMLNFTIVPPPAKAVYQIIDNAAPLALMGLTYDWAFNGWTDEQRAFAHAVFKNATTYFQLAKHPNVDTPADRASNWVGVSRGAELMYNLAAVGDGEYGYPMGRMLSLVEVLERHLEQGYAETGWNQEGMDYLAYGLTGFAMAATTAKIHGLGGLWNVYARLQFAELHMHTVSLRPDTQRVQWGVGNAQGVPMTTSHMLGQVSPQHLGAYMWYFERTSGVLHPKPGFSGSLSPALLALWQNVTMVNPNSIEEIREGRLDDHGAGYNFRNRYQDVDDVLVGVTNRNHDHFGWAGAETFGLSILGPNVTFARQPGKPATIDNNQYSKVMIDGKPENFRTGLGETISSRKFYGQGGGYAQLEGAKNFKVAKADQEIAVDMRRPTAGWGGVQTVIATKDQFSDTLSHSWAWQIAPEPGVKIDLGGLRESDGAWVFTVTKDASYMRGWLVDGVGANASMAGNFSFRISRNGTAATFRIVLAIGKGTPPQGAVSGTTVTINGISYDTDNLSGVWPVTRGQRISTRERIYVVGEDATAATAVEVCGRHGMELAAASGNGDVQIADTLERRQTAATPPTKPIYLRPCPDCTPTPATWSEGRVATVAPDTVGHVLCALTLPSP